MEHRISSVNESIIGSVDLHNKTTLSIPLEFADLLQRNLKGAQAFNSLSPSHQKEYLMVIHDAVHSQTRQRRSQKAVAMMKKRVENGNDPAGYSGKPVWQKLEIKESQTLFVVHPPDNYHDFLSGAPPCEVRVHLSQKPVDMLHLFEMQSSVLFSDARQYHTVVKKGGIIWVSWPKKVSVVATDITEQTVRDSILPLGWVDTKVCAVSAIWSGLKFLRKKVDKSE